MSNPTAKTILFHPDSIKLLDALQERFGLISHEQVIQTAIKLLAVADKNQLYVMRDGLLTEIEVADV